VERRSLALPRLDIAADELSFFRWGRIAGKTLVTNDAGDWLFLNESEFNDLLAGRIVEGHPLFAELQRKGVLRDGLDLDALADRMAQRNRHVGQGPSLHVVTLTARRSADDADGDMSRETAEQVVDLALQSTSPAITFELRGQGGEPVLNFNVLRHLVELARSRNQQAAGKVLSFRLLSNLSAMTEEIAEWLIANDIPVSTTLDGPADVHDWNRKWKGGSAHADVVRWIEYFNRRSLELGRHAAFQPIDALMTTTRRTIEAWQEVIDEYVGRGLHSIHLRPLDQFAFPADTWRTIGYTAHEYLDFYRRALDYILDLNRRGVDLVERVAWIFLSKILTNGDAGALDVQSPNGAGTSQIAYNFDGRVFPSDEARVVDAMGDPIFELGRVGALTIPEILRHPSVRAIAAASLLDAQPMCADCWNKPFCGVSPVYNFATQGDLFAQRPLSFRCKEHMAVSERLFELLANEGDPQTAEILKRWATAVPRLASSAGPPEERP